MEEASKPSTRNAPVTKTSVTKIDTVQQAQKRLSTEVLWHSKPRRRVKMDAIFGSALEALQANRMRSFLTMLGVIIGVSAVIAVVSLTQGVNQSVTQRFAGLGTNVI